MSRPVTLLDEVLGKPELSGLDRRIIRAIDAAITATPGGHVSRPGVWSCLQDRARTEQVPMDVTQEQLRITMDRLCLAELLVRRAGAYTRTHPGAAPDPELTEPVRRRIDWDAVGLGSMSDGALGDQLGVTSQAVRQQRLKRSIPAHRDVARGAMDPTATADTGAPDTKSSGAVDGASAATGPVDSGHTVASAPADDQASGGLPVFGPTPREMGAPAASEACELGYELTGVGAPVDPPARDGTPLEGSPTPFETFVESLDERPWTPYEPVWTDLPAATGAGAPVEPPVPVTHAAPVAAPTPSSAEVRRTYSDWWRLAHRLQAELPGLELEVDAKAGSCLVLLPAGAMTEDGTNILVGVYAGEAVADLPHAGGGWVVQEQLYSDDDVVRATAIAARAQLRHHLIRYEAIAAALRVLGRA